MFHLHHYSHHPVHCFSEGSKMITGRCYYPSSNFHKQVWLIADCPHGRLVLKQENNEQNITCSVIREMVSGEDISSKVHRVLLLSTTCSDRFGEWYMKFRWADMSDLKCTWDRQSSLKCPCCIGNTGVGLDEQTMEKERWIFPFPFLFLHNLHLKLHSVAIFIIN